MSFSAARILLGRILLVAGVLVLLFIPYLLWGTGLKTAHSQSVLRTQFNAEQRRSGAGPAALPHNRTGGTAVAPTVAPAEPAPPVGSAVGIIDIPTIGVNMVVVQGTDELRLQEGPGHYPATPLPGEAGNVAIAGHRTTYLHPFYNLNDLAAGDPIIITTNQGTFRYDVTGSQVVSPDDVAVVDATTTPQLTLTTCNPRFSASQRLVVHAALEASSLTRPAPTAVGSSPARTITSTTEPKSREGAPPTAPARNWLAAVLWGVVVVVVITGVWMVAVPTRRSTRAVVVMVGLVAWLGVVFFFFQSLAPLLPASY